MNPLITEGLYTSARGTVYSGFPGPVSATPEPPSALLVLSGFLGLLTWDRKGSSFARRRAGELIP